MTTRSLTRDRWRRCHLALAGILVSGIIACSSDSVGLKTRDGSADGRADLVTRLDGSAALDTGAGGAAGKRDAAAGEAGTIPLGSGGAIGIDGGVITTGGTGGRAGAPGSGGMAASGGSTGGRGGIGGTAAGGSTAASGGAAGTRTGGAPGTGGRAGGTGGSVPRDAAPGIDSGLDAPRPVDVAIDGTVVRRDASSNRPDTAPPIDGAVLCGYLDEPCCAQRTCNLPSLICESGGGGSEGTCVVCGGEDEACCEGDVCTEPNMVCTGGGRGGGTCRPE